MARRKGSSGKGKTSGKKAAASAVSAKAGEDHSVDVSPPPAKPQVTTVKEETPTTSQAKTGNSADNTNAPGAEETKQSCQYVAAAAAAEVAAAAGAGVGEEAIEDLGGGDNDGEKQVSGRPSSSEGSTGKRPESGRGVEKVARPAETTTTLEEESGVKPELSAAARERETATPARELDDVGVLGNKEAAQAEGKRPDDGSSSDENDGDGFKVVVGREVPPPAAPAAPTKRFLRGTNTLVNTNTTSGAGADEARSTSASKPVSAAAGIASLVPSKGAPVATARPSLKPGEYPPTAELQQSTGKTAFDVDIDGMEEQPWRHPGVDIADFFNYGFTEDSWRVYCEKQLRNRYDQNLGRSKNINVKGIGGRGGHMRFGGGGGARRGGDRQGVLERPIQLHNNGPQGPQLPPQGPAGNGWGGAGPASERFGQGFGSGPAPGGIGHGNVSAPWFDGPPHMRPGNRQHFGPGPAASQDRGGGLIRQGNNNGIGGSGGIRRSRSPDPRDGSSDKMARIR